MQVKIRAHLSGSDATVDVSLPEKFRFQTFNYDVQLTLCCLKKKKHPKKAVAWSLRDNKLACLCMRGKKKTERHHSSPLCICCEFICFLRVFVFGAHSATGM